MRGSAAERRIGRARTPIPVGPGGSGRRHDNMAATYESMSTHEPINFGTNAYVRVQRRRMNDAEAGRAVEFLVIERGYYGVDGQPRWTKFVTVPDDPHVLYSIAEALEAEAHATAKRMAAEAQKTLPVEDGPAAPDEPSDTPSGVEGLERQAKIAKQGRKRKA